MDTPDRAVVSLISIDRHAFTCAPARSGGCGPTSPERMIHADRARAIRRKEQIDEAEQNRWLTMVLDRPESVREVPDEVGEGHLARGDECDGPREEPEQDERAAHDLDHSRSHEQRSERHACRHSAEPTE